MTIGLTNKNIGAVAGLHALLPNQPILHNCHIAAENTLKVGDIVALSNQANMDNLVVVKKAAITDEPIGVVAYGSIVTGYDAGDICSVYPENSYVYLPAASASISRGDKLQFTATGTVAATSVSGQGYIGVAMTEPGVIGDLIVVQIKVGKEA